MKSIKSQLFVLIFIAALPSLGIIIYSNYERQRQDLDIANTNARMMLLGVADDHESVVEVTRALLKTLAKFPAVQNRNGAACNKLFRELLSDNTQYATIFAADREGRLFANALPFGNVSIRERKYFQEAIRSLEFSVGEYTIGAISQRAVLPFAYPIIDSDGRVAGVVAISLDLENYGSSFRAISGFPENSTLNLLDRNFLRLYRYPDNEEHVGKADLPEMRKQSSEGLQEGVFTADGVDGLARLYAYKRFYMKNSPTPYLYVRVGIPKEQALAQSKRRLLRDLGLFLCSLAGAVWIAWMLGTVFIVKRISRLVAASKHVGQGFLSARTGLDHNGDELGQLAHSFDAMAETLEVKELERKQALEKIARLANYDTLTDLPVLRLAKDRLSVAISMSRRHKTITAVMFIDLDGFKTVNDTLGHGAGDYVLVQVAKRLLSCVRESDTVARVGGDEFLFIASGLHAAGNAAQIAEKIISLISQPIIVDGQETAVGASIGISLWPADGEDMDQLIKQADKAMYKIKKTGKNGFCFWS